MGLKYESTGMDVDDTRYTMVWESFPLQCAVSAGHLALVAYLLERSADPNRTTFLWPEARIEYKGREQYRKRRGPQTEVDPENWTGQ